MTRLTASSHSVWEPVATRIADLLGLHFPPERWNDLERGLSRAPGDFGFTNVRELTEWLVTSSPTSSQMRLLANHLTIGETYFFRESKAFDFLRLEVIPRIVEARRRGDRVLRIWSAGCSTGEEAYSLAILVTEVIPDIHQWHVTILATDVNDQFLQRAHAGIYRDWSFRGNTAGRKQRYFERHPKGEFAIRPEVRRHVKFVNLNLVQDTYPSVATDTNAIDILFCRNVLMYFTPEQASNVVQKFHRALLEGGWLVVGAAEGAQTLFANFKTGTYPGIIAYQKPRFGEGLALDNPRGAIAPANERVDVGSPGAAISDEAPGKSPLPAPAEKKQDGDAARLYAEGRYSEVVEQLLTSGDAFDAPAGLSMIAHSLANLGRLREALNWCDRWVAADKLNPASYYLRAMTLQELGETAEARRSLHHALYLQPGLVAAHFALGNLARSEEKGSEAARHFGNALRLLSGYAPEAILPEVAGLTAGRLKELITSLIPLSSM